MVRGQRSFLPWFDSILSMAEMDVIHWLMRIKLMKDKRRCLPCGRWMTLRNRSSRSNIIWWVSISLSSNSASTFYSPVVCLLSQSVLSSTMCCVFYWAIEYSSIFLMSLLCILVMPKILRMIMKKKFEFVKRSCITITFHSLWRHCDRCKNEFSIRRGSIFSTARRVPIKVFLKVMYCWAHSIRYYHAGEFFLHQIPRYFCLPMHTNTYPVLPGTSFDT